MTIISDTLILRFVLKSNTKAQDRRNDFLEKKQQEDKTVTLWHLENDISKIIENLKDFRETLLGESYKIPWVKLWEEIKEELRQGLLEETEQREQALLAMVC